MATEMKLSEVYIACMYSSWLILLSLDEVTQKRATEAIRTFCTQLESGQLLLQSPDGLAIDADPLVVAGFLRRNLLLP